MTTWIVVGTYCRRSIALFSAHTHTLQCAAADTAAACLRCVLRLLHQVSILIHLQPRPNRHLHDREHPKDGRLRELFFRDFMNKFDLIVVLFSILEIILDSVARGGGGENPIPIPLSVLRAFRILRLFKIVKSSKKLKVVLTSLAQSFESVNYLGMLLGLMILIFILLGMELFGGFYPRPGAQLYAGDGAQGVGG